jgi:hypothetical protein
MILPRIKRKDDVLASVPRPDRQGVLLCPLPHIIQYYLFLPDNHGVDTFDRLFEISPDVPVRV